MQKQQALTDGDQAAPPDGDELGAHIDSFAMLRHYVRCDFRSRGVDEPYLRAVFLDPLVRLTLLMRLLEYADGRGISRTALLPLRYWYRRLSIRLGITVAPGIFGPGLTIVHYGLLVMDPTTRVGRNCRIHAGVNVGGSAKFVPSAEMHLHSPRIGHNVYIGPGAKLYGPVTIGDDCVIGANAVITKSFPQRGVTLAGVPAKIIRERGSSGLVITGAG